METILAIAILIFAIVSTVTTIFNYYTHQRNAMVVDRENKVLMNSIERHKEEIEHLQAHIKGMDHYWHRGNAPVALMVHNGGVQMLTRKDIDILQKGFKVEDKETEDESEPKADPLDYGWGYDEAEKKIDEVQEEVAKVEVQEVKTTTHNNFRFNGL
jgi:hypothetical protein